MISANEVVVRDTATNEVVFRYRGKSLSDHLMFAQDSAQSSILGFSDLNGGPDAFRLVASPAVQPPDSKGKGVSPGARGKH